MRLLVRLLSVRSGRERSQSVAPRAAANTRAGPSASRNDEPRSDRRLIKQKDALCGISVSAVPSPPPSYRHRRPDDNPPALSRRQFSLVAIILRPDEWRGRSDRGNDLPRSTNSQVRNRHRPRVGHDADDRRDCRNLADIFDTMARPAWWSVRGRREALRSRNNVVHSGHNSDTDSDSGGLWGRSVPAYTRHRSISQERFPSLGPDDDGLDEFENRQTLPGRRCGCWFDECKPLRGESPATESETMRVLPQTLPHGFRPPLRH